MRGWLRPIGAMAKVTWQEILRDKVLYNILVCTALLIVAGFLAARLTFIRPDRVVLDFGMLALELSCSMIAVFFGATTLIRDFERRTVFLLLSRPISRTQIVFGKFLGLAVVVAINWAILSVALLGVLSLAAVSLRDHLHAALGWGLLLMLLQAWVLGAISTLFSSFTTISLSAMLSLGIYVIGCNVSQLQALASKGESAGSRVLAALAALLPRMELFQLGLQTTYGLPVGARYAAGVLAYGLFWILLALVSASLLIRKKEV